MTKVTCELRALEPGPGSAGADGEPAGAACTKCRGLSAGEANAGAVLIEERAVTLTQFLLAGLVLQSGEEADGRRLSPPGLPAMPLDGAQRSYFFTWNKKEKGNNMVDNIIGVLLGGGGASHRPW